MPWPGIPNVEWPPDPPDAPPESVNRSSSPSISRSNVAADDSTIPVVYGRTMIPGKIGPVTVSGSNLLVCFFLCWGEIDEVEAVYINDELLDVSNYHAYTGKTSQTVDSWLAAAISGYTDTHVLTIGGETRGIAYVVVSISPSADMSGFPRMTAIVKGMKVHKPGVSTYGNRLTYVYEDNPAYALGDWLDSTLYGAGIESIDWVSVTTVALACGENVSGVEQRRLIGIALDKATDTKSHTDALRTYASCMVLNDGSQIELVPDEATETTESFGENDIDGKSEIVLNKSGLTKSSTVVTVRYTDTSEVPWRERTARAKLDGVDAGITIWRETTLHLPGIHRYSQAYREAVERLKAGHLTDLSTKITVFDEGLGVQVGDVIEVTHPIGLSSKKFRVMDVHAMSPGRWMFSLYEYDPAVYSDAVETTPTYNDTNLPDPRDVPDVTGVSASEELYQKKDGSYSTRIRVEWDDASLPVWAEYVVKISRASTVFFEARTKELTIASQEVVGDGSTQYLVEVYAESYGSFQGNADTDTITPQGKFLVPGDVPSLVGFEVGGSVRLSWGEAPDLDIWRYEIRYGATTGSWETATVLDKTDGLRAVIEDIPKGTWRFYVKAIDSVRQESENAAYVDINVTLDFRAFMVDNPESENPATLTNVKSFQHNRYDGVTHYFNDSSTSWDSMFPNAMSTYPNELASYFDDLAVTFETEALDFGEEYVGNFVFDVFLEELGSSSVTVTYYTAPDNSGSPGTWESHSTASFKETARFAKVKIEATVGNTFHTTTPGISVRLTVVTNEESGTGVSQASGGKTITLANDYTLAKSILITPYDNSDATAYIGVADNVSLGDPSTFDVYIFAVGGAQVAKNFSWRFQGI